jgi:hypothetical protein
MALLISFRADLFLMILMPASFFRIRPFAALFFRRERLVYRHHAFELFGIGAGVECHPFNQRQNRGGAVGRWRGRQQGGRPLALLGFWREANPLHQNLSSLSRSDANIAPRLKRWRNSR